MNPSLFILFILLLLLLLFLSKKGYTTGIGRALPVIDVAELEKKVTGWKREGLCRAVLETIFDKPFPTTRPDFLKSPKTGHNLELDCYNPELRLALEYNGQQHYHFPNKFHQSEKEFTSQVSRDKFKQTRCNQKGITLIIVPYNVPKDKIVSHIVDKLKKAGYIKVSK